MYGTSHIQEYSLRHYLRCTCVALQMDSILYQFNVPKILSDALWVSLTWKHELLLKEYRNIWKKFIN